MFRKNILKNKNTKKINVLSLFSGIGAFESALNRGGHEFRLINYCEIDKYASKAYSQIHGISEDFNLWDVKNVNTIMLEDVDLLTYGFPCQDISVAGKQRGFKKQDGSLTRSGLFFEALRIIEELKPRFAIAENVKALVSKKFEEEFKTVLDSLEAAGYRNFYSVLNSKDFGIPQNRERVFIISIRKDLDIKDFKFPQPMPLKIRVKDILEDPVNEKYYLNNQKVDLLINKIIDKNYVTLINDLNELDTMHVKRLGNLYSDTAGGARAGNTYDPNYLSPTLQTSQGGNRQPLIFTNDPIICASGGRNPENSSDRTSGIKTEQRLEINKNGVSNTLTTVQKDNYVLNKYRIRKLTPKECFRLMGFKDEEFYRIHGISDSQLYKMAGNSIVVNVLEAIFKELFK